MLMDSAIRKSTQWKKKDWRPNNHQDIPLDVLERGRCILERAAARVKDDKLLSARLAYARFGHAYLTYVSAINQEKMTESTSRIAQSAFDSANAIRTKYNIPLKAPSARQLFDESANTRILRMPDVWRFKKDPSSAGVAEKWFTRGIDSSWSEITTLRDWTNQDAGRDYHGCAWYEVKFRLPTGLEPDRAINLHFGAVDGYVDIYLDGVKIGEQKNDPSVMWDKPFDIPLPDNVDHSKSHSLMLMVSKDGHAAGVWKPVSIVYDSKSTQKSTPDMRVSD
jgi:hypothetical protein